MQDTLPPPPVLSPSSGVEKSLLLKAFLPGSCTSLQLLLLMLRLVNSASVGGAGSVDDVGVVAEIAVVGGIGGASVRDTLLLLPSSSRVELSLVLRLFPPGSCTSLPLLLLLRPLGLYGRMLLSGLSWLLLGACACSFVIGSASPFLMFEMSACYCVQQQQFRLASVASDGLGREAAGIEEGGGRRSW